MKPFFSYYGSRWSMAKHYGEPEFDTVVEPFAGSAGYSTYWNVPNAVLYELNHDIVAIWNYLIHVPEDDILRLPSKFSSVTEVQSLPEGARQLVFMWVNKGRAEVGNTISSWYWKYSDSSDCKV